MLNLLDLCKFASMSVPSEIYVVSIVVTYLTTLHLMQYEDLRQLCNNPRVRSVVLADMDAIGKEAQVKSIYLMS